MSTDTVQAGVHRPQKWLGEERAHHHPSTGVRPGDRGSGNTLLSKGAQVNGALLVQN